MSIAATLAPIVDLMFPPRCPLCGAGIQSQAGLCSDCWSELAFPGEPACGACGRPFAQTVTPGAICAPCLAEPPQHDGIAAATLYNPISRKLVLTFKHGNRIMLAPMLARLMLAKLGFVDEGWILVPVPLHRWRLWKRGYNQSAELARALARHKGAQLMVDALVRHKATRSLGGLGKAARKRALSGAIRVDPRRAPRLAGARVVLVDDVYTSGATAAACVAALKRAGAQVVVIACFARVLEDAPN
ncbi:ComF family protein [Novosphingobium sp. 1949]|uniref:ComF family protein n=1 Tax=Novosphingobium organovorum TaxID=2930092 RepID=A0ABT0B9Z8_9SPHN|nr:ComF family protein [Novosphingobium organovorum]MCJ2181862.1 ComF family protein [Novosphingobium organovorum]